jgi:serine/threonine protein kinase
MCYCLYKMKNDIETSCTFCVLEQHPRTTTMYMLCTSDHSAFAAARILLHGIGLMQAMMLRQLADVTGVVRLIGSNQTAAPEHLPFLVMQPFGRNLSFSDDARTILGAVRGVAGTIGSMSRLQPPIVHRDVSIGNIVVIDSGEDGITEQVLLIDFATARSLATEQNEHDPSALTGTSLFMACSVLDGEPHSTCSDLESLFLVLLYLACGGHVHWANTIVCSREARDSKKAVLKVQEDFERYVLPKCSRSDLRPFVISLHALFFRPHYNRSVVAETFLHALQVQ